MIERMIAKQAQLDLVLPKERVTIYPSVLYISGLNIAHVIDAFHDASYERVSHPNLIVIKRSSQKLFREWEIESFCRKHHIRAAVDPLDASTLFKQIDDENSLVVATADKNSLSHYADEIVSLHISPTAMARTMATGELEIAVPETVYIDLSGELKEWNKIEELSSYLGKYFRDSLVGAGVIIGGTTVERMTKVQKRILGKFIVQARAAMGIISPLGPYGQVEGVVKIETNRIPTR